MESYGHCQLNAYNYSYFEDNHLILGFSDFPGNQDEYLIPYIWQNAYSSVCSSSFGFSWSFHMILSSHWSSMTAWNFLSSSTFSGGVSSIGDWGPDIRMKACNTIIVFQYKPNPYHQLTLQIARFQHRLTSHPLVCLYHWFFVALYPRHQHSIGYRLAVSKTVLARHAQLHINIHYQI